MLGAGSAAMRPAAALACPPAERCDVAVDGLVKRYGDTTVLAGVRLAVPAGQALALLGPNGAGKSTLLRCCLRLVEPDDGAVRILDQDVRRLGPAALRRLRAKVGFVFQRHNLVPRLSALSNVIHGALARGRGLAALGRAFAPRRLRAEAMACLDRVGLAGHALQRADRLSGGQSQRVAIARALMQQPHLMFADEPAASLDPAAGEEVMRIFVALMRAEGRTLIFTSHDLRHARDYADRVVVLREGAVAFDAAARSVDTATLRELYARA